MKISATCALMLLTLTTLGVGAQTPVAPADPAAAAQAVRVPPPTVDPAKELKGTALVEALRKGGRGGVADREPRAVGRDPVAVDDAHARGGAVPGEHHVARPVDPGEIG